MYLLLEFVILGADDFGFISSIARIRFTTRSIVGTRTFIVFRVLNFNYCGSFVVVIVSLNISSRLL